MGWALIHGLTSLHVASLSSLPCFALLQTSSFWQAQQLVFLLDLLPPQLSPATIERLRTSPVPYRASHSAKKRPHDLAPPSTSKLQTSDSKVCTGRRAISLNSLLRDDIVCDECSSRRQHLYHISSFIMAAQVSQSSSDPAGMYKNIELRACSISTRHPLNGHISADRF